MDYSKLGTVVLLLLGFAACFVRTEGTCAFEGSLFANSTEWKPESCQECICHDSIAVCEKIFCKDPQCDFTKGEVLRIDHNKCCPECASRKEGSCQDKGKEHAHGTQWPQSKCSTCTCLHGKVTCAPKPCLRTSCDAGEVEVVSPGECCPICMGSGESCSFNGLVMKDGEEWRLSQCSRCTCRNGVTQCITADCLPMLCDKDDILAVVPGKCCPECLPKSCTVSGKIYEHGVQWKKNPCSTCICDKGEVKCHNKECSSLTCVKT